MRNNKHISLSVKTALIFLCLTVFQVNNGIAQKYFELANVGYLISPNNPSEYADNKTTLTYSYLNIRVPKILANKDIVMVGLLGEHFTMAHSATLNTGLPYLNKSISYNNAGLLLSYMHNWNADFNTSVTLGNYIASDYSNLSGNDYRFDVLMLFTHKKSETFKYKYGVLWKHEFSGNVIWPGVGLDWYPNEKNSLSVLLPQYIKYNHSVTPRLSLGAFFWVNMSTYRFDDSNVYLDQQMSEFMLSTGFFVTKNILLQGMVGKSLGRFSKFYPKNERFDYKIAGQFINNNRTPLNLDFKNGFLLELRLSYNIATN